MVEQRFGINEKGPNLVLAQVSDAFELKRLIVIENALVNFETRFGDLE